MLGIVALEGPNSVKSPTHLTLILTLTLHLFLALTLIVHTFRQDWVSEASDAIYPLFDAILQYTIETLVLDANILRDSILVRLEMVSKYFTAPKVISFPNTPTYFPCI
jgi:hypothetical protein